MADAKISALTELTAPDPVDEFVLVDKSDASEAASGTDKKILMQTIDQRALTIAQGIPPTGVTYQNFDRNLPNTVATGATLTSGTMKLVAIMLPAGITITSIAFCSGTTALTTSGTAPHAWAALYSSAPTTGTPLLRQSTDDTAATWAANSIKQFTLSSTFVTTYTGLHYCGLMVACGSTGTMPTMMTIADTSSILQGLAPILTANSSTGQTTTAPNPAGALTATTNKYWCGVA